ncbi:MAG: ATPase [Bacteroides sp. SM1_62]|nr:MAG: ATPase [Bacteroides sp. SM23_62]KPL24709.1 MAG: ATPase [Bacteroides sp. SM1_62]
MKNIRKTIHIKSPMEEVFNAITNPLTIELWSGYPAVMEPVPGTLFSMFDGDITGTLLAIEPPSMLEQQWDFGEQTVPSIVRIKLSEEGHKTRIELDHSNVPDEAFDNINTGWKEYFFGALKSYLEG